VPFMVRNGGTQRWQLRLIGATRELLMPEGNPWQWGPAHSYWVKSSDVVYDG